MEIDRILKNPSYIYDKKLICREVNIAVIETLKLLSLIKHPPCFNIYRKFRSPI